MTVKCRFCGQTIPDNAIYCNNCGKKLISDDKKTLLLIDASPTSNFVLTKKLKQHGFDVKSFNNISFALDELSKKQYTAMAASLNLDIQKDIDFLRKVRTSFNSLPIILLVKTLKKQHLPLVKELNIFLTAQRPINLQYLIENIEKIPEHKMPKHKTKYPIYKTSDIEKILEKNIKKDSPMHIIMFYFTDFNHDTIMGIEHELDSIYNSLKRSDSFLIIADMGLMIIPEEGTSAEGAKTVMRKIHNKIKKNITQNPVLRNCRIFDIQKDNIDIANIAKKVTDGYSADKTDEKEVSKIVEKDVIVEKELDIAEVDLEQIVKDKHLLFSIIFSMDKKTVASLYYDTKFKPVISPYLTIAHAKEIKQIDAKAKIDTSYAKEIFNKTALYIINKNNVVQNDVLFDKIDSDVSLMTLPEIQNNIIFLINEDASFRKIVSEISKDSAISSKILKLANSAFFGFSKQIKNLHKAATILGTEEILGISLSIAYVNSLSKNIRLVKQLWKQTTAVLAVIKFIERYGKINTYASTAAVLHNIGKMFLTQYYPEKHMEILKKAQKNQIPYSAAEIKYISIPHTQIGYKIADLWNLPDKIKSAILYHHYPSVSQSTYLNVLNASICIVDDLGYGINSQSIDCMSYHSYTILRKKHGIDILNMLKQKRQNIIDTIKDMMLILS